MRLRPFFKYLGGKYRAAPYYPRPRFGRIIEPFAGSAGYSMRYPEREVLLIEKYEPLAEMWKFLIRVKESEFLKIPAVDNVEDLPAWVPEPAKTLAGYNVNVATATPRNKLSPSSYRLRERGRNMGWTRERIETIAGQLSSIRHWTVVRGDFMSMIVKYPESTWFVDPPYKSMKIYPHNDLDHEELGRRLVSIDGQVIACETKGADWLPFREMNRHKKWIRNPEGSPEVMWTNVMEDGK